MRTFSMPLSGITAMPFESGAADAAVAKSAEAPAASAIIALYIMNSFEVPARQWLQRPIVPEAERRREKGNCLAGVFSVRACGCRKPNASALVVDVSGNR